MPNNSNVERSDPPSSADTQISNLYLFILDTLAESPAISDEYIKAVSGATSIASSPQFGVGVNDGLVLQRDVAIHCTGEKGEGNTYKWIGLLDSALRNHNVALDCLETEGLKDLEVIVRLYHQDKSAVQISLKYKEPVHEECVEECADTCVRAKSQKARGLVGFTFTCNAQAHRDSKSSAASKWSIGDLDCTVYSI